MVAEGQIQFQGQSGQLGQVFSQNLKKKMESWDYSSIVQYTLVNPQIWSWGDRRG